jgi:hypothetical protein
MSASVFYRHLPGIQGLVNQKLCNEDHNLRKIVGHRALYSKLCPGRSGTRLDLLDESMIAENRNDPKILEKTKERFLIRSFAALALE